MPMGGGQGGALVFQLRQEWINAFVWVSTFLVTFAAILAPHAAEPAALLFSVGAPWLAVAVAVRLFQHRTRRAALRAVEPDRRAYDALWRALLADPGPLAQLDAAALQASSPDLCTPDAHPAAVGRRGLCSGPGPGWVGDRRAVDSEGARAEKARAPRVCWV